MGIQLHTIRKYANEYFQDFKPFGSAADVIKLLKRTAIGLSTLIAAFLLTFTWLMTLIPYLLIAALSSHDMKSLKKNLFRSPASNNSIHALFLIYVAYVGLVNVGQMFVIPVRAIITGFVWGKRRMSKKPLADQEMSGADPDDMKENMEEGSDLRLPLWNETTTLAQHVNNMLFNSPLSSVGNIDAYKIRKAADKSGMDARVEQVKGMLTVSKDVFFRAFTRQAMRGYVSAYQDKKARNDEVIALLRGVKDSIEALLIIFVTLIQLPAEFIALCFTSFTWYGFWVEVNHLSYKASYELLGAGVVCVMGLSQLRHLLMIPVRMAITTMNGYRGTDQDVQGQTVPTNDNPNHTERQFLEAILDGSAPRAEPVLSLPQKTTSSHTWFSASATPPPGNVPTELRLQGQNNHI